MRDEIPLEHILQMDRPVWQVPGEIRGMLDRTEYMLSIAESALADISLSDMDKPGVSLSAVVVVAPWNYPLLMVINSVLPASIAGNARLVNVFHKEGVPWDVLQVIHLSPELTTAVVKNQLVDLAMFTGSVAGGHAIDIAAVEASGFKCVGLERVSLGVRIPPTYVLTPMWIIPWPSSLMVRVRTDRVSPHGTHQPYFSGAMFNSGQSCCTVEE
ncbi:Aldehyde/histidinol dehydrogenase [Trametes maxima]|nr:Aldehyde/histidinol dehydrogenase [Trametes maxima]